MPTQYHERCLTCEFLAPSLKPPCGRLFRATVDISPIGGNFDIVFTPGLIPEEFDDRLRLALVQIFDFVKTAVENWKGWDDLAELQKNNPEKKDCPGRVETKNPFLRVVK